MRLSKKPIITFLIIFFMGELLLFISFRETARSLVSPIAVFWLVISGLFGRIEALESKYEELLKEKDSKVNDK